MSDTDHSHLTRAEVRSVTETDKLNIGSQLARPDHNINNTKELTIILSLDHMASGHSLFCLKN